jgi:transposase
MMCINKVSHIESKEQTKFYIGIDVHKKSWAVTIRALGMELQTFSMDPSPKDLAKHMKRKYPNGLYVSAYEAGFCGFWVHHELVAHGIISRVVHAADVPTTNKEKVHKQDKVDSRKLARELENGGLNAIYVPSPEHQQLRTLCRSRTSCTGQVTRVKNRIKSNLSYYGIALSHSETTRHWSAAFILDLERKCVEDTAEAATLRFLLEELKEHRFRLSRITRELKRFCKNSGYSETLKHLLTVPGLGFVTSATLITEIIDINRFPKIDDLCSYVGLVPSTHSSGDKQRINGLTPRKNKRLKHLIIEAAWVAIRKDPQLLETFSGLIKRMTKTDAIIRICRKLLNRIRHVWRNQADYAMAF